MLPTVLRKLRAELVKDIQQRKVGAYKRSVLYRVAGLLTKGIDDIPLISYLTNIPQEQVEQHIKELDKLTTEIPPTREYVEKIPPKKLVLSEVDEKILALVLHGVTNPDALVQILGIDKKQLEESLSTLHEAKLLYRDFMSLTEAGRKYVVVELSQKV
jgi:hypothetical protein